MEESLPSDRVVEEMVRDTVLLTELHFEVSCNMYHFKYTSHLYPNVINYSCPVSMIKKAVWTFQQLQALDLKQFIHKHPDLHMVIEGLSMNHDNPSHFQDLVNILRTTETEHV